MYVFFSISHASVFLCSLISLRAFLCVEHIAVVMEVLEGGLWEAAGWTV